LETLPIANKKLFLQYAIPCGQVLVKRGTLDSKLLESLRKDVVSDKDIDLDISSLFPVASKMCTIIAKNMGRDIIDDDIIRRYFLIEHEKAIRWRAQIFPDISLKECFVYVGKVIKADEKTIVKTQNGERVLDNNLWTELKKGDFITTHYDYVAERIPPELARKVLEKGMI